MRYGTIDGVAKRVSRLVLGSVGLREDDMPLATALLNGFAAAGGTAVDTAFSYGRGASERAIGSWLRDAGQRERFAVITKGAHPVQGWEMRVNPEAIRSDMAASLERLGVDAIDVYLLHRDDPSVPVGPIVDCLDEAWRAGKVRAYGGSNWSTARIEAANAYAGEHGKRPFVVSSPNVALAVPNEPMWVGCVSITGDAEARAWYARAQMPVLSWSSGARGFFTGRFAPGRVDDADVARVYDSPENWARLERAREVASRKGATAAQVALAWVLHQPFPTFALIGPMTVAELEESLGAAEMELSDEEVRFLG
jgi:aryl-alcohol dehydrogenase-like predicted oxidoreductase